MVGVLTLLCLVGCFWKLSSVLSSGCALLQASVPTFVVIDDEHVVNHTFGLLDGSLGKLPQELVSDGDPCSLHAKFLAPRR